MTAGDELFDAVMQDAASLLRGLADNELTGLYVIQGGRLAAMFGYVATELCPALGPMDLTAPEHRTPTQTHIDRRLEGRSKTAHYRFQGLRKDGSRFEVEVFGVATTYRGASAIVGILVDVDDRSRAEREVSNQLRFIAQLIDTIPSPVLYKDIAGRYLGCNRAFEEFAGRPRAELIGRTVFDIATPQVAEQADAADRQLMAAPGTTSYEGKAVHAGGAIHDVIFHKATFDNGDGKVDGLVTVMFDISERKRMEERIWQEANYDALSGLPNRRLFRDRLREEIKRARRSGRGLALLVVDLDRFKEINDTLGHALGDRLIVEVGRRVRACIRDSDTVARQGGDEYMVILPDIADPTRIAKAARHILDEVARPIDLDGHTLYASASIGVALYPDDAVDMDALLSYADQAMYAAKENGRNGFSYFTPSLHERARLRLQLANDLRGALAGGQLSVYMQPIVAMADGAVKGEVLKAEALLRWRHPVLGMIPPDQFIPIAEEIGLIHEIGDWVFRESALAARRWADLPGLRRPVQVSVNKSPRQLMTGTTHESWIAHLREIGLPPACVAIEITEGLLMDTRPEVASKLLHFRDAGIQVSLDDFGTGYSAMSYLKKFDIDYLKIDKSFVRDMTTDPGDRAIAEAIIVMAHKLGIEVIAEGVETAEQRDLLAAAGCDYGQGYLFARPMPLEDFEHFLIEANRGGDPGAAPDA